MVSIFCDCISLCSIFTDVRPYCFYYVVIGLQNLENDSPEIYRKFSTPLQPYVVTTACLSCCNYVHDVAWSCAILFN